MKKFIITVLAVTVLASGVFAQAMVRGYLVDVLCGEAGYPEGYQGRINLATNPEKNVVACLTMANCQATGFGLSIQGKDGAYVFHPFDKASSDLVRKQIVAKLRAMGDPAPYIEVNGLASATGVISRITKATLIRNSGSPSGGTGLPGMSGHNM